MRVLISSCSGFWISREAIEMARRLEAPWAFDIPLWDEEGFLGRRDKPADTTMTDDEWRKFEEHYELPDEVPRHDPHLLAVFDEVGPDRMAGFDDEDYIIAVDVPDDVTYSVQSETGEWVAERHRIWTERDGESPDAWHYFTKDSTYPVGVTR